MVCKCFFDTILNINVESGSCFSYFKIEPPYNSASVLLLLSRSFSCACSSYKAELQKDNSGTEICPLHSNYFNFNNKAVFCLHIFNLALQSS